MRRISFIIIMLVFAFGLTACGEEEMCIGKGGIEYPCDEVEPTENNYLDPGTYIVGTDIEPGLHFFEVNTGNGEVQRLDGSNQIIASQSTPDRLWIEVKSTDSKVMFTGGILWKLDEYTANGNLTVWNEGGYLVGTELPSGEYLFKMEPGETEATLTLVSAVDFESTSITQTFTSTDETTGVTVTIPSTVYAVYIEGGHLVQE